MPSRERSTKGKKYYPSIEIIFNIKVLPFAQLLLQIIGHGSIQLKKDSNAAVLVIRNVAGLIRVVNLINGRIRTPKIDALYLLIDLLNANQS